MQRSSFAVILVMYTALLAACGAPATPAPTPALAIAASPLATAAAALPAAVSPTSVPKSSTVKSVELTVFAAASLTDAFNEIGKNFATANPGVKLTFSFAGSNALAAQIGQGAPADIFASANDSQMTVAVKTGRINGGATRAFARNRLVMIVAKGVNRVTRLQDLANPGLKVVLADKAVPVGQYALDFMDKAVKDAAFGAGYKDAVSKNVVSYEQDVKAVLAKVALGEADAGIVYTTDVLGANAAKVQKLDIPDALNTLASYPVGVLTDSKNGEAAKKFFDYMLSTDAQSVLARYGFMPVTGSASGGVPGNAPVVSSGPVDKPATLASADSAKLAQVLTAPCLVIQ